MQNSSSAMQNSSLEAALLMLEERLLQPGVRKSAKELQNLLAEDFLEFGSSGRTFNKQQLIDGLAHETENDPLTHCQAILPRLPTDEAVYAELDRQRRRVKLSFELNTATNTKKRGHCWPHPPTSYSVYLT